MLRTKRFYFGRALYGILLLSLSVVYSACGQSAANSGEVVGEIRDIASAIIPAAVVVVRNLDTNYTRTVHADGAGRYALLDIPIGPYEVKASAPGFEPSSQSVFVTLGSSVSGLFRLLVAAHTESVEVTAQNPGIEPTRSTPKTILTELQINELPSNGRRLQNNVLETPGTLIEPECRAAFPFPVRRAYTPTSPSTAAITTAPGAAAFVVALSPPRLST